MAKLTSLAFGVWLAIVGSAQAQPKPEAIRRGKQATALVEVSRGKVQVSGSAFCIDPSGLFITNAHVVEGEDNKERTVRLVIDVGAASQRTAPAKVLRHDDRLDLALLQIDPSPPPTALSLGRDANLKELSQVFTFGYPFGSSTVVGRAQYPDITVLPSHVTALRRDHGELAAIQFDNQINPGNSGGPVLDGAGRVVGVAMATVRGGALNMAIPVSRLEDFLKAPGLDFEPPDFSYAERTHPMTWTVRLQRPRPQAKLPEGVAIALTLSNGRSNTHTYAVQPAGGGVFEIKAIPAPRDPDWRVDLTAMKGQGGPQRFSLRVPDEDVRGGGTQFMTRVLRTLRAGRPLRATVDHKSGDGQPSRPLGKVSTTDGGKSVTIDLNEAENIDAWTRTPSRTQTIDAIVEAKQGSKIIAAVRRRIRLVVPPGVDPGLKENPVVVVIPRPSVKPAYHRPPLDEGKLKLSPALHTDGVPEGTSKGIRPSHVAVPAAALAPGTAGAPLVRRVDGTISDVVVGGGGRFLILTLKDAQKLAIFDVNAGEIVKTIAFPSPDALVTAGDKKLLIVFPEENVLQRWDLATLQRDGGTRPSPIDGRILRLALGHDSEGPALVLWSHVVRQDGSPETQFSLLNVDTLTVPTVSLIASRGSRSSISISGGSFRISDASSDLNDRAHLRASSSGALFGIWPTTRTLAIRSDVLLVNDVHTDCGYVAPGPDGFTVFTGWSGRLDRDGKPSVRTGTSPQTTPAATMASTDPAYYLSVSGLADSLTGYVNPSFSTRRSPPGAVTASIHATGDGSKLLTIHGLDEMAVEVTEDGQRTSTQSLASDFTLEKRFLLIPPAHLLITIPPSNDRLVLRRLDLDQALARGGGSYLVVTSAPVVAAKVGQPLEHQIVARSRAGGLAYTLAHGPDSLKISPDGRLTWTAPKAFGGDDVIASIRVRDAAGLERLHRLAIMVEQ